MHVLSDEFAGCCQAGLPGVRSAPLLVAVPYRGWSGCGVGNDGLEGVMDVAVGVGAFGGGFGRLFGPGRGVEGAAGGEVVAETAGGGGLGAAVGGHWRALR